MAQEWEIKALGHVCAGTGEPFADGQSLISCLVRGAEGYERHDYSDAGWRAAAKGGVLSFWKTVYRAPAPPAPDPMKKETVETLLRQYMAKEDFSRLNAIYILAVMLERKRVLVEKDVQTRDDGTKIRIYEHKKTGEIFTIPDPQLRLTELEPVQKEVEELLGLGATEESRETSPEVPTLGNEN